MAVEFEYDFSFLNTQKKKLKWQHIVNKRNFFIENEHNFKLPEIPINNTLGRPACCAFVKLNNKSQRSGLTIENSVIVQFK